MDVQKMIKDINDKRAVGQDPEVEEMMLEQLQQSFKTIRTRYDSDEAAWKEFNQRHGLS